MRNIILRRICKCKKIYIFNCIKKKFKNENKAKLKIICVYTKKKACPVGLAAKSNGIYTTTWP